MSETVKDLMPQTTDLNAERLAKLKELFPDLFTDEGGLNETELKKLIDPKSVNETERYEFRWFGKSNAKRKAFTPTAATLNYDAARSVNPDASENLIIEGENLKVLKLLLCSYREQIKCIYIDPPYNTGNDFVYSDNYSEDRLPYWKQTHVIDEYGVKIDTNTDANGRYHSNWMNMMFSRLLVARQLLRKDGVIFISIDDNEVHNLRKLCNEVFGEENFVDCIIWKKRYGGGAKEKYLVSLHEYVLMYAKDINLINPIYVETDQKAIDRYYKSKDENFEIRGAYRTHPLEATKSMGERKNLVFPIPVPDGTEVLPKRQWLWNKERVEKAIKKGELEFLKDKDGNWSVHTKQYLMDEDGNVREAKAFSIIENIYTQHGTNEIIDIFGNAQIFSFPKPTEFVKRLLKIGLEENDEIVLDFFGGSGTTGQAVMELNEADGGNRKFILVQLPELTDERSEAYKAGYHRISDITIERNKRVVNRIIEEKRAAHPNLFVNADGEADALKGLGFKVFKLEASYFPRTEWTPDPEATEDENVASLKDYIKHKEAQLYIDFDHAKLLTEILLKEGFKLNYAVKPFVAITANEVLHVSDADKEALVCVQKADIANETVEYFKTNKDLKFICLERALDTTKKWNLANSLGEKFKAL
jgi:adenine-specific DNA-methyltransferase